MLPLLTPKLPQVPDRRDRNSVKGIYERIEKAAGERRSFRDRRASPRMLVMVSLEIETNDAQAGAHRAAYQTHDLSTFGLAIRSGATPPTGSRVSLRIFLTDGVVDPVDLKGEVVGPFDAQGGARVKFIRPPAEAIKRLHKFLT